MANFSYDPLVFGLKSNQNIKLRHDYPSHRLLRRWSRTSGTVLSRFLTLKLDAIDLVVAVLSLQRSFHRKPMNKFRHRTVYTRPQLLIMNSIEFFERNHFTKWIIKNFTVINRHDQSSNHQSNFVCIRSGNPFGYRRNLRRNRFRNDKQLFALCKR